jgi:hypothetical protein
MHIKKSEKVMQMCSEIVKISMKMIYERSTKLDRGVKLMYLPVETISILTA